MVAEKRGCRPILTEVSAWSCLWVTSPDPVVCVRLPWWGVVYPEPKRPAEPAPDLMKAGRPYRSSLQTFKLVLIITEMPRLLP